MNITEQGNDTQVPVQGISIEQVEAVVKRELPECWLPLEACLSVISAAKLKDVHHCIGLILVGQPGGRKGTTLSMLGSNDPIYRLDDFTPASFVSADATKTPEQLSRIDLLPQIRHKILVVDELAPMFSKRYEDLVAGIGITTKIMDGKGYWRATGTHGRRGYEGDYRFNMICGTTPPEHKVWQALGKLSSRWIFYNLGKATLTDDIRRDYGVALTECARVVQQFIEGFWQEGYATEDWDRSQDSEELAEWLRWSADSTCKWRGLIQQQDSTGYNPPLIETPSRLRETLYALARGHALLMGRHNIEGEDATFAIDINQTNMPEDRYRLLQAYNHLVVEYIRNGGSCNDAHEFGMGLREAARVIECSTDKAVKVFNELQDLGILHYDDGTQKWYRAI
ncbi:MAG: hypothetical protein PHQ86_05415 [Dehalococcoidales bacterium]|nr:hypothetical protein [Dehalococcoidales bacterium]